jgi:hypothetical protein
MVNETSCKGIPQTAYIQTLFSKNGLSPAPDQELIDLMNQNLGYFNEADLVKFLKADGKFNKTPVYVGQEDGTAEKVSWYHLRQSLTVLPGYLESAKKAGLSYEASNELLLHTMNAIKHDFVEEYQTISLLGRALDRMGSNNANLQEKLDVFMNMIKLGANKGVLDGSLYAFTIANRIGLSVEQACKMIMKLPEADGILSGYTFPSFNDALKSLSLAKVNPDLVIEVFDILGGKRPYYQQGNYQSFEDLITFGCPGHEISPNEMLELFVTYAENRKNKENLIFEAFYDELKSKKSIEEFEAMNPEERLEKHFIPTTGPLEHAALPYRNKRSLNEGVRDLEKLAVASSANWEEVGEGMWTFDPKTSTWYSFGGKPKILPERVRHEFISYDVSELSANPLFFHVHPEDWEIFIAPPRSGIVFPSLRKKWIKFLAATPGSGDYSALANFLKESKGKLSQPKAYIAHSIGITEFGFPNDFTKLNAMGKLSRHLRDKVIIDELDNAQKYGLRENEGPFDFVQRLIHEQNVRTPDFEMVLYPTGFHFE